MAAAEQKTDKKRQEYIDVLHDDFYGQDRYILSPFGYLLNPKNPEKYQVPLLYCDWTASGKPLKSIEDYLRSNVYPFYANTHTETSITGKQTSLFRDEARDSILHSPSVNADPKQDCVIFTGNGCTGAIYTLANILMKSPNHSAKTSVVFIGLYEHNSNIYIWLELGCKLVIIPESSDGGIDTKILEAELKKYSESPDYNLLVGSFTGASNISGIIEKHDEITSLLHKYNALSLWDYATGAPYLNINFSQTKIGDEKTQDNDKNSNAQGSRKLGNYVADFAKNKDAVFISSHKFLGGPGGPGVLLIKKKLYNNFSVAPIVPGGGTMFLAFGINAGQYEYYHKIEDREEGGTPNILGTFRSAMAFKVKDFVGYKKIAEIETNYIESFWKELGINDPTSDFYEKIEIIGNTECERLPIISFNIKYNDKYLHYNFIASLFNDLFGIQGRGGCSCAGMYGLATLKRLDQKRKQKKKKEQEEERIRKLSSGGDSSTSDGGCASPLSSSAAAINKSLSAAAATVGTPIPTKHAEDYEVDSQHMVNELHKGNALAKLGYFRINFHYTMTPDEFKYVCDCIKFVCKNGWKFLGLYQIDPQSGLYIHRSVCVEHNNKKCYCYNNDSNVDKTAYLSLDAFDVLGNKNQTTGREKTVVDKSGTRRNIDFSEYLKKAQAILFNLKDYLPSKDEITKNEDTLEDNQRFYWLPSELYDDIKKAAGL